MMATVTLIETDEQVLAWRQEQLEALGWEPERAERIAELREVDLSYVRKLRAQDVSLDLCERIVLPATVYPDDLVVPVLAEEPSEEEAE